MIMKKSSVPLLAMLASLPAFSEEPAQATATDESASIINSAEEEVVAVGYMFKGEQAAREEQRNAKSIMNIISADGIGKLPDRNAAEAVQRIPGVSIERDQGEGRFVAVRGLPSQWNSTSINGNRLPTAEEETTSRATAFDFFPTEMIKSVRVSKAITPDMEGDSIGGNVDFETKTAPQERVLDITLGTNYNDRAEESGYNANILFGDRTEDGKFGYLLNATTWVRDWATDNYEPRRTDFTNSAGEKVSGIKRLELRDYTGTRTTEGLNGAMEYNFDNGDRIYASSLYGTLEDEEIHYKHRYRFDKDRVEVQHIYNTLITEMKGYELGGEHFLNNAASKLEWSLATYENEFRYGNTPNADDKSYFVMRFDQDNVGFTGLEMNQAGSKGYAVNEIDGGSDPKDAVSNHLPNGFSMDPTQMAIDSVELYKISIKEKDKIIAQLDFTHMLNDSTDIKFGGKFREKERVARFSDEFYTWDTTNHGAAPTLADLGNIYGLTDQPGRDDFLPEIDVDYDKDFSQVLDVKDTVDFWNKNKDKFELSPDSYTVENGAALGRNFDVNETQLAVYGMATISVSDETSVIAGVRLEQTDTEVDGWEFDETANQTVRKKGSNDYLSVLPAVHVNHALNDDANVRFALTRTFSRPDFGALAPGKTVVSHDEEIYEGNPNLDPTYSTNVDFMYDMYFGDVGVFSAGVFYKDISDVIYQEIGTITYGGLTDADYIKYTSADSAHLYGAEFAVSSRLDFLSNALYHFGVSANATFMDSEMEIMTKDGKRDVSIPRQADSLYNLAAFYDNSVWAAKIAMNFKGSYIEEHGSDKQHDRYYGDYTSVDFTSSYKPLDELMVYLEVNNLGNSELNYYQGDEDRPVQVEYYGMRTTLGLKYSFY